MFGLHPKFVYAPIPKAGCTTLLTQIYKKFRFENPSIPFIGSRDFELGGFHQFMTWHFTLSRLPVPDAEGLLHDPDVFRFSFVRNPLARLASGFLNKFVHDRFDPTQWTHTLPVLKRFHGEKAVPWVHTISFSQFVEYVCTSTDGQLDKHWRPMTCFLNDRCDFFIGRMENMAEDYATVCGAIGLPPELPHIRATEYEAEVALPDDAFWTMDCDQLRELPVLPKALRLYNEDLKSAVRKRYRRDFDRFGY